ncbi:G8 domain-containing protein [Halobacteriovorax sp. RT-2-4]|uniref:G8 domain-containing protein n=1 Tax=unclassified Halobacteriovorax TaxID=2639665 RepID=UPI00399C278C
MRDLFRTFVVISFGILSLNNVYAEIKGHIDAVKLVNNKLVVSGWACDQTVNQSINVHIYAGDSLSSKKILSNFKASNPSEAAVSNVCQNTFNKHRFAHVFSDDQWKANAGKLVFGFGISLTGGANLQIGKSGYFRIPTYVTDRKISDFYTTSGQNLTIPNGITATLDRDINVGLLQVDGEFRCPDNTSSYQIIAKGILVNGKFICGTSSKRFQGNLRIELADGLELNSGNHSMGKRAFAVHGQGQLHLHGAYKNSGIIKLASHANPGDTSITLSTNVNWKKNDEIIISSTSFDMNEAERVKVVSVNNNVVVLNRALYHKHWGVNRTLSHSGKSWTLDNRATVANLTRNILITSYGGGHESSYLGGHVMVMGNAKAYVDSVQFSKLGRMGEMARYPFHWHMVGNASGQYIKNSSVTDSYQRCITVHATNYVSVIGNVCYNHFGHGYFLEDGNEVKNTLSHNIGLVSKKVPESRALLISDVRGVAARFPSPSTFWISNPDNTVAYNVAAGSEGTGFWMAFEKNRICSPDGLCSTPITNNTLRYDNNTAHSSKVGHTWDGAPDGALRNNPNNPEDRELVSAHYGPSTYPVFKNLVAFKNTESGIYFRGRAAQFDNAVLADNRWAIFTAYSQRFTNSAIVGQSANNSNKDKGILASALPGNSFVSGIVVYDGPFELDNVTFFDYPNTQQSYNGKNITPIPITNIGGANRFENKVRGLKFATTPWKRFYYETNNQNWIDSPYSMSVRDLDGSLTGVSGSVVVPYNSFNNNGCSARTNWNAYVCNYNLGLFTFRSVKGRNGVEDNNKIYFTLKRGAQAKVLTSIASSNWSNKFNTIVGTNDIYQVDFESVPSLDKQFKINYQAESNQATSAVVQIVGGNNCDLIGATKLQSLSALRGHNGNGYYVSANSMYLRMKATIVHPWHAKAPLSNSFYRTMDITCR